MSKICDMDCFNCKYEDCINDYVPVPHKISKEQQEKYNKRGRDLYHQRIENGYCGRCGKPLYLPHSHCYCYECYIKMQRKYALSREKNAALKEYRRANGLCEFCDEPHLPNKKCCQRHYDAKINNLVKANLKNKENTTHGHYWSKYDHAVTFKKKGRENLCGL